MDQPVNQNQSPDRPVEGTVVATGSSPVGFTGSPVTSSDGRQAAVPGWQQGYWAPAPALSTPVRRRKRWLPFALAGAGVVLLVGGGAGGYAIGQANADAAGTTSQTGTLVPGTDGAQGQFPGPAGGSSGQLGTPPDMSGGFGSQSGQQGGTTGGTTDGTTDSGTAAGTTT